MHWNQKQPAQKKKPKSKKRKVDKHKNLDNVLTGLAGMLLTSVVVKMFDISYKMEATVKPPSPETIDVDCEIVPTNKLLPHNETNTGTGSK